MQFCHIFLLIAHLCAADDVSRKKNHAGWRELWSYLSSRVGTYASDVTTLTCRVVILCRLRYCCCRCDCAMPLFIGRPSSPILRCHRMLRNSNAAVRCVLVCVLWVLCDNFDVERFLIMSEGSGAGGIQRDVPRRKKNYDRDEDDSEGRRHQRGDISFWIPSGVVLRWLVAK